MSKIHEKIMKVDFAKKLKKLIILAVCVMLLGGGLSVAMLWTQIGEVVSYVNQREQMKESYGANGVQDNVNQDQSGDNENWNDEGRERDGKYYGKNRKGENELGDRGGEEGRYREEHDFFENMVVTKPTIAAIITVGATAFCGFLLLLLFWLLVAAWLYQAAVRSGMNGLLWMAAGMVGNVYAAVIFLLVRSFTRKKCHSCDVFLPRKTQHCPKCGAAMREKCENCGADCASGDQFCHLCGKQLHESNENMEN